jgi:hypothetical protein
MEIYKGIIIYIILLNPQKGTLYSLYYSKRFKVQYLDLLNLFFVINIKTVLDIKLSIHKGMRF